jgi:uncharacterized membrane protein
MCYCASSDLCPTFSTWRVHVPSQFQEKMLWTQLLGIATVVVFYAHYLFHAPPGHRYFHVFLIALLLLFAFVRTLLRRRSGNVVQDERDRSIACIGARWSNIILWVGLVAILVV